MKEGLKSAGITREVAQEVIASWRQAGVTDEAALRKLLVGRSLGAAGFSTIQLLLDLGAAVGSLSTVAYLEQTGAWGSFNPVVSTVFALLGGYFAFGVVFDIIRLGALAVATNQFRTSGGAFLDAMLELADANGGTALVDKATGAVNMIKVVQGLNSIADILKSSEPSSAEMLSDLGAYLVLDKAERERGFRPAAYGLSDAEAAGIARVFGEVDGDDNGVIDAAEFRKLCSKYAPDLSEPEVRQAITIVDSNANGVIDFEEFVAWVVNKVQPPKEPEAASDA